jgi:LysR family hydrogen peroxide-inducible transcriptional activator
MNINDLEKIVVIAEEGSMAKASKKLFITQPALSKCLTKVEKELGEVLFIRRPNGLVTTAAGAYLIQKAHQIMRLYDDVQVEFCELNHMRKGILKIGTAERIGGIILPALLTQFKKKYPNIELNITEADSKQLEKMCIAGELDLVIVCLPAHDFRLNYDVFYEEPLLVALPSGHFLNEKTYSKEGFKRRFIDLNLLKDENFILTNQNKTTRRAANHVLNQLEFTPKVIMEFKNIETVIRLVANNMGISIVPQVYTQTYNTGDDICYYAIEDKYQAQWQWGLAYRDTISALSRPSRELYKMICSQGLVLPDYFK